MTNFHARVCNCLKLLAPINTMSDTKKRYECTACGTSFATHEGLVKHNVEVHGADIGTQLRQSEEIQKERERE